ncbi:MAG: hypothetical protein EA369_00115 [Bradymonadales bacterium]|nr:MAG: hypothetical protein EA369_00115 [Bradymonadales bacterium]
MRDPERLRIEAGGAYPGPVLYETLDLNNARQNLGDHDVIKDSAYAASGKQIVEMFQRAEVFNTAILAGVSGAERRKLFNERPDLDDFEDLMKRDKSIFQLPVGAVFPGRTGAMYGGAHDGTVSLEYIRRFAVALPWNEVRIEYSPTRRETPLGYFIASAWLPVTNQLVFGGSHFVAYSKEYRNPTNVRVPHGCGVPLDVHATRSNCGPSAMAALLRLPTETVINELVPKWKRDNYLLWQDISRGLERGGMATRHVWIRQAKRNLTSFKDAFAELSGKRGMVLIMFSRHGKSLNQGHWVAYADGRIYDQNAVQPDGTTGSWVTEKYWHEEVLPRLLEQMRYYQGFMAPTGFYISTLLVEESN